MMTSSKIWGYCRLRRTAFAACGPLWLVHRIGKCPVRRAAGGLCATRGTAAAQAKVATMSMPQSDPVGDRTTTRPLVNGAGLVDLERTQIELLVPIGPVSAQSVHQRNSQAGRWQRMRGILDDGTG